MNQRPQELQLADSEAARLTPFTESGPRAQVLTQLVEAFLDLGSNRPVAMPAVAQLVDGRRLVAADAPVEHAWKTARQALRLRLLIVSQPLDPGAGDPRRLDRQRRHDSPSLRI